MLNETATVFRVAVLEEGKSSLGGNHGGVHIISTLVISAIMSSTCRDESNLNTLRSGVLPALLPARNGKLATPTDASKNRLRPLAWKSSKQTVLTSEDILDVEARTDR